MAVLLDTVRNPWPPDWQALMSPLDTSRIRAEVVREALSNRGYGESGGNNRGRFIRAMGGTEGQDWCALFAGWCYRTAYAKVGPGIGPMFCYRRTNVLETSAKALTKALGRAGSIWQPSGYWAGPMEYVEDRLPKPGDLVCWSRGLLGWRGHVGIVLEGGQYISGNEGKRGTVTVRDISDCKLTLYRFASIEP